MNLQPVQVWVLERLLIGLQVRLNKASRYIASRSAGQGWGGSHNDFS